MWTFKFKQNYIEKLTKYIVIGHDSLIEVVLSFALGLKVTLLAYVRQSFLVFTQKSAETIIDTHTLRVLD